MPTNPYAKAAIAAVLIGTGIAILLSAVTDVTNSAPCEDCEEDALESIGDVASASADMTDEESDVA